MSDEELAALKKLPDTLLREDVKVAHEYGIRNQAAVRAKQIEISAARDIRISRCVQHLEAGWCFSDAVTFAGARDEWDAALRKARMPQMEREQAV